MSKIVGQGNYTLHFIIDLCRHFKTIYYIYYSISHYHGLLHLCKNKIVERRIGVFFIELFLIHKTLLNSNSNISLTFISFMFIKWCRYPIWIAWSSNTNKKRTWLRRAFRNKIKLRIEKMQQQQDQMLNPMKIYIPVT